GYNCHFQLEVFMDAIPQTSERKIHYHTGFLTCPQNTVIIIAGLAAVTALVIGVLALLHAQGVLNAGPFGAIPLKGTYALLGVGGALLLVDVIALIVLVKGRKSVTAHWESQMRRTEPFLFATSSYFLSGYEVYVKRAEGSEEYHRFSDIESRDRFVKKLALPRSF
ncbi:hypothetical protein ACFLR2_00305, partial [Chlamydiota bacterium]